jgi:hypothetical protein
MLHKLIQITDQLFAVRPECTLLRASSTVTPCVTYLTLLTNGHHDANFGGSGLPLQRSYSVSSTRSEKIPTSLFYHRHSLQDLSC